MRFEVEDRAVEATVHGQLRQLGGTPFECSVAVGIVNAVDEFAVAHATSVAHEEAANGRVVDLNLLVLLSLFAAAAGRAEIGRTHLAASGEAAAPDTPCELGRPSMVARIRYWLRCRSWRRRAGR